MRNNNLFWIEHRNESIFQDYFKGMKYSQIGKKYNLSATQARSIVMRAESRHERAERVWTFDDYQEWDRSERRRFFTIPLTDKPLNSVMQRAA